MFLLSTEKVTATFKNDKIITIFEGKKIVPKKFFPKFFQKLILHVEEGSNV